MVIDHDSVEHVGLLVLAVHPEYIAVDAVVEGSGRDLDLVLGAADVVSQRENLVVCLRNQPVPDEEGADRYQERRGDQRGDNAGERHAGGLYRKQLVVLGHLPDDHHRGQKRGQRKGERENREDSPHQELQNHAQAETLAHQLVDVEPEELHHQNEDYDQQDRDEWSDKGFEYETVESLHVLSFLSGPGFGGPGLCG